MPAGAFSEARDDERLREALVELERARAREEQARAEAATLLDALEAMTRAPSPSEALAALLERVARAVEAEAAAILEPAAEGAVRIAHAMPAALVGERWNEPAGRGARPRRIIDVDHARLGTPPAFRGYRSMMSTPLALGDGGAAALACFAPARARFSARHLQLLTRLGGLATQALAAHALWERHALIGGVVEGSAHAMAILDAGEPDRPCVYLNPAWEALTGQPSGDSLGRPLRALCGDGRQDADPAARDALRAAVEARDAGVFELRERRRDGSPYWARVTVFPVRDAAGASRHVVVTQTDISDQRRAQAERDAARAQLDSALSSTREGFAVLGAAGALAYANDAFADYFPTPRGWRPGEDFATLWRESRAAAGLAPDAAVAEGRRRRDWVFSGDVAQEERLPDGRTVLVSATPTRDHGAVVTVADVTPLKHAEALLARRAAAIEAAQDGIALTDGEGKFTYMNPSHLAMFGFDAAEEVVGVPWDTLYEPDVAERMGREAFPAIASAGRWRGEALGRTRDGRVVEQEVSLTGLPDGGVVCVTRDISERRRNERERLRLREEVQIAHRREAVGQIAASVAHDFNNLLAVVSVAAATAETTLAPDAPARAPLASIARAARNGAELMGRLLGLGGRSRTRVRLDLAEPLRNVADLLAAGAGPHVAVETDLPPAPLTAEADPGDILHLALNLGVNARDALGPAGGRIRLSLARATPGDLGRAPLLGAVDPRRDYALIAVADDGEGVPPALVASIFRPDVSTKGDAGTGLGLAIVAGVVAENDAALFLDSPPGAGATFGVLWPLDPAPASEKGVGDASLAGKAVLVAEDAPEVLARMTAALERAGAEVGPCEDPLAAAEAVEDDPDAWALVVTDFEMPGLDGAGLAARVRAAAPGTPVILCTGAPEAAIAPARGLFDAVLRKPVDDDALLAAARRALARAAGDGT